MEKSPTETANVEPASTEPTGQPQVANAADINQEAISSDKTQEVTTDASAQKQTENKSGESDNDLAKFAKGQGIEDFESLNDREKKLLKVAHDNVKSYRSNVGKKVEEVANELNTPDADSTDVQKLASKVQAMEYSQVRSEFFARPGIKPELESTMVEILNEKKEKYGKDYAKTLSQDLDMLYQLAELKSGVINPTTAKEEGRREERESIRNQQIASAPGAHASTSMANTGPAKVTPEWIRNEYDPRNAEHRAMVDAYYKR